MTQYGRPNLALAGLLVTGMSSSTLKIVMTLIMNYFLETYS